MEQLKNELKKLLKEKESLLNYYYIDSFEIYLINEEIKEIKKQIEKMKGIK